MQRPFKKERPPFNKSFGTAISEFVIDLAVLFLMAIVAILLQWNLFETYFLNDVVNKLKSRLSIVAILVAAIVVAIIATIYFIKKTRK